jgi:hypothetical protein
MPIDQNILKAIAAGGGMGASAGALSTLFDKEKSLKNALKRALIGGAGGAAIGGAVSAIQGSTDDRGQSRQEFAEPPKPQEVTVDTSKPHMSQLTAAFAGLLPPLAAIHGGVVGGGGQALRSGGTALGGGLLGGALLGALAGGRGALLGQLLGSVAGSSYAAHKFNEEQDKAASLKEKLHNSDLSIAPLSTGGGALAGGLAGTALGGGAGLVKALFDSEDDTILSTLRKALSGAAYGSLGGAALGAGASTLLRNRATSHALGTDQPGMHEVDPRKREMVDRMLRRTEVPVGDALLHLTGQLTPEEFSKSVDKTNAKETGYHMLATLAQAARSHPRNPVESSLNRFITRNDPSTPRNQPTTNP